MERLRRFALLAVVLVIGFTTTAAARNDKDQIRERRLSYTAAIQSRRPDLMADYVAEDMVQLSSNGDMVVGAKEIIRSYAEHEFRNPNFLAYERTPDTVAISDNGRFGVERGHWRGRFRVPGGGVSGNAGLYQAGWIKRAGVWWVRTESYVRMHCANESDCPK